MFISTIRGIWSEHQSGTVEVADAYAFKVMSKEYESTVDDIFCRA